MIEKEILLSDVVKKVKNIFRKNILKIFLASIIFTIIFSIFDFILNKEVKVSAKIRLLGAESYDIIPSLYYKEGHSFNDFAGSNNTSPIIGLLTSSDVLIGAGKNIQMFDHLKVVSDTGEYLIKVKDKINAELVKDNYLVIYYQDRSVDKAAQYLNNVIELTNAKIINSVDSKNLSIVKSVENNLNLIQTQIKQNDSLSQFNSIYKLLNDKLITEYNQNMSNYLAIKASVANKTKRALYVMEPASHFISKSEKYKHILILIYCFIISFLFFSFIALIIGKD